MALSVRWGELAMASPKLSYSSCDKIVMDSLGEIDFKGIAMSLLYFKDMLDNANITPYIFRAQHLKYVGLYSVMCL